MNQKLSKNAIRIKRHKRQRKNIFGTPERPRLNIFRSLKNIYAQVIDDTAGETIVSASTQDKEITGEASAANIEGAKAVGELVAKRALDKGIETVVFDRGGYIYHGRVKALAEAARQAGLKF